MIEPINAGSDGFLSEKELLKRLPICRRTLGIWRKARRIPYVRIGRRILFNWTAVSNALLRMQTAVCE
jgi:hypothetical protein